MWATEGIKIEPAAGTILADTGSLPIGIINTVIIIVTSANCTLELAQRNALNTVDNKMLVLPINTVPLFTMSIPFSLLLNERIVLRMLEGFKGSGIDIQANILF